MMSPIEQAQKYLEACPPAVSGEGGHNATFHLACEMVHGFGLSSSDAIAAMSDWNARCQPPWDSSDLNYKINSAILSNYSKPNGWRCSAKPNKLEYKIKNMKPAASPTVALLKAAFHEGEGVGISVAVESEDGRTVPASKGLVLSREEWIAKIEAKGGDVNKIWSGDAGGFIRINPMKVLGATDADVTNQYSLLF